jgi:cysteine desulfurase
MAGLPPTAYLDHASAWPLPASVRDEMVRWTAHVGSPMALHESARGPSDMLEDARRAIRALAGWPDGAVILTAGATEARNLGVAGALSAARAVAPVIVADPGAHSSTLAVARSLTRRAGALRLLPLTPDGDLAATDPRLAAELAGADMVVVTHGQAEVGAVRDARALVDAARASAPHAVVLLDAEETAGLEDITHGHGADLVVVGGRSLGGPAWAGALLVREGVPLHPLIEGGVEEGGKRGGAHDVPGIAGLGEAARLAHAARVARSAHMRAAGKRLVDGMLAVPGTALNGPGPGRRLPGHVQVSASGVEGEAVALGMAARGVAVSPGSACTFGAGKASPVLEAMGMDDERARSAVLVTAGPWTTDAEVDRAIAAFRASVEALRAMGPA